MKNLTDDEVMQRMRALLLDDNVLEACIGVMKVAIETFGEKPREGFRKALGAFVVFAAEKYDVPPMPHDPSKN